MTSRSSVLLAGVLFAAVHTQSPLYYSNQNQYFLHGLAAAGFGHLSGDWLATTADPTPVFSGFVAAAYRLLGEWPFQAVFFAALVGYFVTLWKLVSSLTPSPPHPLTPSFFWPWSAAITFAHAGVVRWASDRLLGADYPWFLQCGLANQYLLGPGLQPSVIGVLLIAAVAAYATGRPVLAAGLAAGANVVHATYLLPAGLLVAGFVAGEFAGRRWKAGLLAGSVALLVVAPVVAFHLWRFGPTDPAAFAEAQRILADVRIPHHARPDRWFDGAAAFQVVWMLLGLVALRRTRLFVPLAVTAVLAAAGTAVVLATDDPTAALLFPWRVSAVLVPVSTAVLFARVIGRAARVSGPVRTPPQTAPRSDGRAPRAADAPARSRGPLAFLVVSCLLSLVSCLAVYDFGLGYREPASEDPALAFVRDTAKPGDVYLVPARFPKPTAARGVYSMTFAPPPDPSAVVYFELARFRLATGARQYVDFKSIPYRADEVMEWDRRVANCVRWFGSSDWSGVLPELRREGITHVVAPAKLGLSAAGLTQVFEGGAYRVYRID